MNGIKIIERPDDISFESIREVLQQAHASNKEKGINLHTTEFSAEEIEKHIGDKGKCFVALDGEKVVGTASYRIISRKSWYVDGVVADEVLIGILPEYKGKHIFSALHETIENEIKQLGYDIIVYNTAKANIPIQRFGLSRGFRFVGFFVAEDNDHYSVVLAKWLKKCPFSALRIWFGYNKMKLKTVIMYKPGKIKRFGL